MEWIPVKWHEIAEEEREKEGYSKDWVLCMDSPLPNDNEEILITVRCNSGKTHVEIDVCYVDDGWSLDSGYDWVNDVIAWMPLPKPYKGE